MRQFVFRGSLLNSLACAALLVGLMSGGGAKAGEVTIRRDVVYGHKDGMALTFDVLTPAAPNQAGVLWLQSGGWYSRWNLPEGLIGSAQPLLDAGFTVFIVRHGSAPRYAVPDAVGDVRRCVRFIRMTASDYNLDADRLGAQGGSAGGHLTLMLATTGDDGQPEAKDPVDRVSSRIAAGVALYPPTDLRGWTTDPPAIIAANAGLKPPLTFSADLEDDVSPVLHVTADDAPVLMIHGDKDELVPIAHSTNIVPLLEKAKVPHRLITVEGAGHGYNPEQYRTIVTPSTVEWFQKYLTRGVAPATKATGDVGQ
ncbi:MAG: prolyl oligopeptidase family serine peptidase [Planctomycetaceae bacterium]